MKYQPAGNGVGIKTISVAVKENISCYHRSHQPVTHWDYLCAIQVVGDNADGQAGGIQVEIDQRDQRRG